MNFNARHSVEIFKPICELESILGQRRNTRIAEKSWIT